MLSSLFFVSKKPSFVDSQPENNGQVTTWPTPIRLRLSEYNAKSYLSIVEREQARAKLKWYFAYTIEGDTIFIQDACHAQNMK